MNDWPPFEYASDEHLDGLSRDALYSEIRFLFSLAEDCKDENAKLRELVRQVEICAVYKGTCTMCPMIEFEYGRNPICTSRISELKRELGIDVPDE